MPKKFILSNETSLDGLHRRPKYDELIGEINKPLITQYPDRKATQLRNSNWLQQLDGDDYESLKQMNHNIMKEHEKRNIVKTLCSRLRGSIRRGKINAFKTSGNSTTNNRIF